MNELKIPTNLETISLKEQKSYRSNEISDIKGFECEIKDQELFTKKISKYIICFDYTDKILTAFLTIFNGVNNFSHVKENGYKGLFSSIFFFNFLFKYWNNNKTLYIKI